jgi:hypothetical protein
MLGARVEDECFNRPDFVFDPVEQVDNRILVPRIARDPLRQTAICFDLGDQFAERLDLPPRRDSDQSFAGKPPCNSAPRASPAPIMTAAPGMAGSERNHDAAHRGIAI